MKRLFNITNIYLLLLFIYQMQGVLYEGGGVLSKYLIMMLVLYMIIVSIYANIHFKLPLYFTGLNLLLSMFTIYGLIHMCTTQFDYIWIKDASSASYTYLLSIYLSLLPIYVFYTGTILGQWNKQKIQIWTIIILFISIAKFFLYYINNTNVVGEDEITNNCGYLFLGIISLLVFFNDKSLIQYILIAICIILVLDSMKRGAILTASCCLIIFIVSQWKSSQNNKRITHILIFGLLVIGAIFFIKHMLQTSEYFIYRVNDTLEGESSDRDVIFKQLLNYYNYKASLAQQIFGGGANFTLQVSTNFAHNDWLEILINQGFLGCVIYIIYWYFFWKEQKSCRNIPRLESTRIGLIICFVASLLPTLFSMSYGDLPIGETMAIGICLGQKSLYQLGKNNIMI